MSRSGSSGVDEAPAGHCKTCPLTCTTALTQNLEPSELLTAAKMEQARGEGLLLQHCLHESLNSTRHGLVLGKTVGLATKELRFDGLMCRKVLGVQAWTCRSSDIASNRLHEESCVVPFSVSVFTLAFHL